MNPLRMNVFRKSDIASDFFLSHKYPLTVALITVLGYSFGVEFYLNILNMLLLAFGILKTRSALPLVPVVCLYLFSVSPKNSPESHFGSDFYNSAAIVSVIALLFLACIVISLIVMRERGVFSSLSLSDFPLFKSSLWLSSAFLFGGLLSGEWEVENLLYGSLLIAVYFGVFYFFSLAFKKENGHTVIRYLIYTAVAMAAVLIFETAHLYITNENIIKNGEIVKEQVLYGWGMWTMAGQFLAVTIPLCFLGVIKQKHWWIYFGVASLALLCTVFTLSRNALLVGILIYILCVAFCFFFARHKRAFIITVLCVFSVALLIFAIFNKEILTALSDYIERGFSNNGRFALWEHGIKAFLEEPFFGKGFFGLQRDAEGGTPEGFTFYPRMMHNTQVQLLGACGIYGLLAYTVYRIGTLLPFFKKPSVEKIMLLFTLAVIILGSLIDNFLFLPKHLIFYSITLCALFKIAKE